MLTDNERAELIEFAAQVNELVLNEKDELIIRHFLQLAKALRIKTVLLKKKEQKLKIERGMSFSNAEKLMREYTR